MPPVLGEQAFNELPLRSSTKVALKKFDDLDEMAPQQQVWAQKNKLRIHVQIPENQDPKHDKQSML
jgi:hypothetical protein